MQSAYLDAQAQNGAATPYLVHLLLDEAVPLEREALVKNLSSRIGRIEPLDPKSKVLHFYLPEYPSRIEGVVVPLQLAVLVLEGISVDELAMCLRQSWTWPEAGVVASQCRASLTLSDFYGSGIDRRVRLALFHGALSGLLDELPVRAVQWLPSQQVIEPGAYLRQLAKGEGLRGSAVNVRRFRTRADPESVIQVVDTLGLAAFGLPDLQLRYVGLTAEEASEWLYQRATELFETGSVGGTAEWSFDETTSIAGPSRRVLDFTRRKT